MSIKKTRDFQITLGLTCKILCTLPSRLIHQKLIGLFGKEICEVSKSTEDDIIECYLQIPPNVRIPFFNDIDNLLIIPNNKYHTSRLFFISFFVPSLIKRIFSNIIDLDVLKYTEKINQGIFRNEKSTMNILMEWIMELIKWEYEDRFKIMKAVCRLPCYFKQGLESRIYIGFTFTNEAWRDRYWELLRPIVKTSKLPTIYKGALYDIAMFIEVLKEEIKDNNLTDYIKNKKLSVFSSTVSLSSNYSILDKWCMLLSSQTPFFDSVNVIFRWCLTSKQIDYMKANLCNNYYLITPEVYIEEIIKKY